MEVSNSVSESECNISSSGTIFGWLYEAKINGEYWPIFISFGIIVEFVKPISVLFSLLFPMKTSENH